jgi:hypothetical protein
MPRPHVQIPVSPANDHTAVSVNRHMYYTSLLLLSKPWLPYNPNTLVCLSLTSFQGLNILNSGKKSVRKELSGRVEELEAWDPRKTGLDLDDLSLAVNLNVVALYFQALTQDNHPLAPPVISKPIQHNSESEEDKSLSIIPFQARTHPHISESLKGKSCAWSQLILSTFT